ncbi:uncharacterized protein AKAME5_002860000 [Lates japonicus]|uniref:Uncharacterized protein n=1 Tax=Lates japonicus TaxID=270547 RepID=A0AAD3MLN5_LATJO|nr:uncharacterized protein AKAME5_002860000 [Lates japonicus]
MYKERQRDRERESDGCSTGGEKKKREDEEEARSVKECDDERGRRPQRESERRLGTTRNHLMVPTGSPGHTLTHTDLGYHLRTHRQIHIDIRAVQQQDAAGDGGPRGPGRRDVNRRSPGDHGGRVDDLLLMGQEQGVPCHPSCSPPPLLLLLLLLPLYRPARPSLSSGSGSESGG